MAITKWPIEGLGVVEPEAYESLRDEAYLHYRYGGNAKGYVEDVLEINEYQCAKEGGEFPVYECPECGEKQLVYDAEKGDFHCFSCDKNYTDKDLIFCERCGNIMQRSGNSTICKTCIRDIKED